MPFYRNGGGAWTGGSATASMANVNAVVFACAPPHRAYVSALVCLSCWADGKPAGQGRIFLGRINSWLLKPLLEAGIFIT